MVIRMPKSLQSEFGNRIDQNLVGNILTKFLHRAVAALFLIVTEAFLYSLYAQDGIQV